MNGGRRPGSDQDGLGGGNGGGFHRDYSHIFNEREKKVMLRRTMQTQRLVQDPFYEIMNLNTASRMWMLHNLKYLAEFVETAYNCNLVKFFELMGRDTALHFFRSKNAPIDMIKNWEKDYLPGRDDEPDNPPGNAGLAPA